MHHIQIVPVVQIVYEKLLEENSDAEFPLAKSRRWIGARSSSSRLMTRWCFGSVEAVNELQTPREDVSLQNLKSHQDSVSTNRVTVTGNTSTRRSFSVYNLVIETF